MSTLAANFIQSLAGKRILNTTGGILQVVSTTKTDTFTSTSTSFTNITGLSASITPTSSTNKILVMARVCGAGTNGSNRAQFRVLRGATPIGVGDAASPRWQVSMGELYLPESNAFSSTLFFHLDSPATTSETTYQVQVVCGNATGTVYVNRNQTDGANSYEPRGSSSITVMEIVA